MVIDILVCLVYWYCYFFKIVCIFYDVVMFVELVVFG